MRLLSPVAVTHSVCQRSAGRRRSSWPSRRPLGPQHGAPSPRLQEHGSGRVVFFRLLHRPPAPFGRLTRVRSAAFSLSPVLACSSLLALVRCMTLALVSEKGQHATKARGCLEPVPGARSSGGSGLRVLPRSAFCSGGDGASHLSRQSTGLLRGTPSQRGTLPHMLPCFAPLLLTGSARRGPRRLPAPGSCMRRCGTRAAAAS